MSRKETLVLRKWGFVGVAVAVVLVGCAGGGTTITTSGSGGGTTALVTSRVNIPGSAANYGHVEIGFLTGQGRGGFRVGMRVGAAFIAKLGHTELRDEVGLVENPLDGGLTLPLAGFQFQTKTLDVPFNVGSSRYNTRLFTSYNLDLSFEQGGSALGSPAGIPLTIPTRIRALPGRSTMLPIYVDDAIFTIDDTTGSVVFNQSIFDAVNRADGKPIKAFINDYVSFDLAGLPAGERPVMNDGATLAGRVYFTGDNYAISEAGNSGVFEALTLSVDSPILGSFGPPAAGTSGMPGHAGTFSVYTPNPTNPDPTVTMDIVALQGTWRDYQSVLTNISSFEIITFPSSDDNNFQEMVAFTRTGTTITNLYFGFADFAATATTGAFHLWPVKNIVSAAVDNQLDGELTNFLNKNQTSTSSFVSTRYGSYSFAAGSALPGGFKSAGNFTVFRL